MELKLKRGWDINCPAPFFCVHSDNKSTRRESNSMLFKIFTYSVPCISHLLECAWRRLHGFFNRTWDAVVVLAVPYLKGDSGTKYVLAAVDHQEVQGGDERDAGAGEVRPRIRHHRNIKV